MTTTESSRRARRDALRADRQRQTRASRAAQKRRQLLITLGSVVAVAILVTVGVITIVQRQGESDLPPLVAVSDPYAGMPQSAHLLGNPDAPLRIVEYGDYQCPVCQQASQTVVPVLVERYVATGALSFEFRDFLVIDGNLSQRIPDYDPESLRAAEGALCAADQGQYWAFHKSLYENHTGEGVGDFSESRVKELAGLLGLDTNQFNQCLDENTYEAQVQAQSAAARDAGIGGTPTFMIGDQQISTASVADFTAQIDGILAANGIAVPATGGATGVIGAASVPSDLISIADRPTWVQRSWAVAAGFPA
ncbi:MAG TPA: thioredoxin domain-containing protein [Thermomicrobiales bacterium]|jgi:protein-disulfide isomerase|nr:thioredoxin domain-containing protein [Thermomicrobiales bacterium]